MSQPSGEVTYRFARKYRLTKTDEFSSVFGFRKAIRGQWLMLHYQPRTNGESSARLGLVIGKKQLKRAVDRNRVKRIAREHFRLARATLPGCDLIVRLMVRPSPLDGRALAEDLEKLFERLRRPRRDKV